MQELAIRHPGSVVSVEAGRALEMAQEFERRLAECSTLAFRVAMGVLHNHEDAEDVAQEAFLRAYRNFHQLRERFRAWIARIAWRLAIDRWRSAGRRERREQERSMLRPHPAWRMWRPRANFSGISSARWTNCRKNSGSF